MKMFQGLAAAAALCMASILASAPAAAASAQEQLRDFVGKVNGATGSFSQYTVNAQGRTQPAQTGTFSFQRPGKFKWAVQKPYEQLVISDGAKVYQYDPDLLQVTERKVDAAIGTRPPRSCSARARWSSRSRCRRCRQGRPGLAARQAAQRRRRFFARGYRFEGQPAGARRAAGFLRPDDAGGPVGHHPESVHRRQGIPVHRAQGRGCGQDVDGRRQRHATPKQTAPRRIRGAVCWSTTGVEARALASLARPRGSGSAGPQRRPWGSAQRFGGHLLYATQSISTLASTISGDCTQARAGGFSPKYSLNTLLNDGKSRASSSHTPQRTTCSGP